MSNVSDFRLVTPVLITDAVLVSSSIAETDYAAYAAGTSYSIGNRVIVTTAGVHKIYESLINSNLGNDPTLAANATKWAEVSATNRWKMFDLVSNTSSTDASTIDVVLAPGRIDTLGLMDVDAVTARVRMTTVAEGTFFDKTYTLTGAGDSVSDWWEYFYSPIGQRRSLVLTELPSITDAQVRVTLTRTGGDVSLGSLVVGTSLLVGAAQHGVRAGINDYSVKSVDAFGRASLVPRAFAKRMSLSLTVARSKVDSVIRSLAAMRATLVLAVAGTGYEALQVYGWYRDFDVSIAGPYFSTLSIEFEGIT